ncbi:MAG: ABC transporter permease subunit [bacterium]|nr:ABC transporter permease subunit [bacterium]
MIRSVAHPTTGHWHRAHRTRARRMWLIMLVVLVGAAALAAFGYFAQVGLVPLASALADTTYRLVLAYILALALGVTIALLVGSSPLADTLFPFFDVLQNIPSFALLPIFIYFLGFTGEMIILFAVSSIIWPILFAILTAIKAAHADLNDAATIFGATGLRRIPYYLAPLSFPAILTGSIVGIAIGWEAVIGAEIIANTSGFGIFISSAGTSGISPASVAGVVGILLIVFVVNRLIWAPLLAESAKRYAE